MKTSTLMIVALALSTPVFPADYDLGALAAAGKMEVFNRTLDPSKAGSPKAVFLNAGANDGVAWITGVEFSKGTIELEIKGTQRQLTNQ